MRLAGFAPKRPKASIRLSFASFIEYSSAPRHDGLLIADEQNARSRPPAQCVVAERKSETSAGNTGFLYSPARLVTFQFVRLRLLAPFRRVLQAKSHLRKA
jgi:hypothetical protein